MDRKNKIRDIIVIVISVIIITLGINNISKAASESLSVNRGIGATLQLGYNDTAKHGGYDNVFCVEHGDSIFGRRITYTVRDIITIDGNDASDTRGNAQNGKIETGILAHVIASNINATDKQELIWVTMTDWKNVMNPNREDPTNVIENTFPRLEGYGIKAGNLTEERLSNNAKIVLGNAKSYARGINDKYITQRKTNITVQKSVNGYQKGGYSIVGPIILDYGSDLNDIILKDQNGNILNKTSTVNNKSILNYKYIEIDNNGGLTADLSPNDAASLSTGETFYILIRDEYFKNVNKLTIIPKISYARKSATIVFLKSSIASWQNLIITDSDKKTVEESVEIDVSLTGNLKIEKVDKNNHNIKLPNVKFTLTNSSGHYVTQSGQITSTYSEINTDPYGNLSISNIPVGTYTLTEKSNPNYGYEMDPNGITVNVGTGDNSVTVENEQKYIYISGKVWEEEKSGKDSVVINNVLDGNDYILGKHTDSNNLWLDNIKVYLKKYERDSAGNRTGNVYTIDQHTTWGGYYRFPGNNSNYNIKIADLKDYFIEFEYNGLTYECVRSGEGGLWENPNSSTAREDAMRDNNYGWTYPENDYNVRKNFNKKFANIENGGAVNKGVAKDENGNNGIGLDYTINNHEAELNNRGYYWKEGWNITADTHRALLDLEAYYRYLRGDSAYNTDHHPVTQVSDITNVNLGLYRREQPDLALVKDIYDIRATINNYDYTYPYNQRFLNQAEYGNGFDNSVKYSDKYSSMGYTRAVYESDYEFIDYKDPYKELQLYVTYKIAIRNQSTSLTSQVNSIVDYYENRYELVGVGTSPEVDKTTRKD